MKSISINIALRKVLIPVISFIADVNVVGDAVEVFNFLINGSKNAVQVSGNSLAGLIGEDEIDIAEG